MDRRPATGRLAAGCDLSGRKRPPNCKVAMADNYRRAVSCSDLPERGTAAVEIDAVNVIICRDESGVFALENRCTHQESPLQGGRIRRGAIMCPMHGAPFALKTGACLSQLAYAPIRTFAVKVEDDWVFVDLTSPAVDAG